jgi:protein SCO1/2
VRRTVPLIAVLALLVLTAAGCGSSAAKTGGPSATTTTNASGFAGAAVLPARPAQAISLHDADGRPVTLTGQRGRYVLVTFLYTHCPDVCPLIAANLNAALRALGPSRKSVRVLAVSVDPVGDTARAVHAYEKRLHFVPQFRYLIGTRAQLRKVWARWSVLSVERNAGIVDHVAYTALIDTAGNERVLYGSHVRAQQVIHDLRRLMQTA